MNPATPLLALLLLAPFLIAAGPAPLVLEATIPLEHTTGRIDHMAVDLARNRLFIAELGNGTVDVVDIPGRRAIARIDGLNEPQGVGYTALADLLVVASAGDGTVRFYRGTDLAPVGTLPLGDDADNVRVDPHSGTVIVGYGHGGLAIIDPITRTKRADIPLHRHPEGFQLDETGARAFVNVPDAQQVAVVDLATRRLAGTWRIPSARSTFPMAYDPAAHLLLTVARTPPKLILLSTQTGLVTASLDACADADDVFHDATRHRIYVICGSGQIDTWQQDGPAYRPLLSTPTSWGARTALFVQALDRLFVAQRAGLFGSTATLAIYRPAD